MFVSIHRFQLISARRIWAATKKQMIIEEDIAWLKHRLALTSSSLSSSLCSSNPLIYCVIDDIDTNLNQLKETTQVSTIESVTTKEVERLELLKKDIIQQAISTSKRLIQDLCDSIQVERTNEETYLGV